MTLFYRYWQPTFFIDLVILAATAPVLYAANRLGTVFVIPALILLGSGWLWRRYKEGVWYQPTPADWSLLLLFLVMLPVSIWAAPEPFRTQYSWQKAYVLLWNLQLFVVIVTNVSRHRNLFVVALSLFLGIALLFALVAPLGTNWLYKLPGSEAVLSKLPTVLKGISREGGSGFHPNIVAGALLFALPLMISLTTASWLRGRQRSMWQGPLTGATVYVLIIFVLLQSRSGYMGLTVAIAAMIAIQYPWGRRLLILAAGVVVLLLMFRGNELVRLVADNPSFDAVGGTATLTDFRADLWINTLRMIRDFPVTGAGLGTFQESLSLLYPTNIPPDFYFGHAHNFWLQAAAEFGIPGLVAILAIYIVAVAQLYRSRCSSVAESIPGLVIGLWGSLVAQSFFGLTDSLSMGTTANLLFWFLFALIFALGNIEVGTRF